VEIAQVPCPVCRPGHLLVQTTRSLISAGTERSLVEFSQAGLLGKARAQPDKVKQVLQKIKTDGLLPTMEAVFSRLDEPLPLGYCNVGTVVEVGRGVDGFSVGDRVASNGPHAEMVCVPQTLAARIPEGVTDDEASFTVLGAIALQGIRLAQPTFGETFAVTGLGLLGLLTVQLLRAHGCSVLGIDINPDRCKMAESFGCRTVTPSDGGDPIKAAAALSKGHGIDGVLITASAKSDDIVHQAAQMCRKRGRIVLVGVVGLNLRRSDFYEKELSFQVSCSYGPGRYDTQYEQRTQDYPLPYVRWPVARNFEAVLAAMAQQSVDAQPLISDRIEHAEAARAYERVVNNANVLGLVLTYPQQAPPTERTIDTKRTETKTAKATAPVVGLIGAGNFAKLVLMPAIQAAGADVRCIASSGGVTAAHLAGKFNVAQSATDYRTIIDSAAITAVFIATRHNTHAAMVSEALAAGKHVFVEKPLAIDETGLNQVREAHAAHPGLHLMVGFNRRFAPHAVAVRRLLENRSDPMAVVMTVNAGDLPSNHWLHDPEVGGGRIVGEGCHFIDLAMYLVGEAITSVQAVMFGPDTGGRRDDKTTISLSFADGSIATIHYLANGPKSFPKERIEVFSEGRVATIDNWRRIVSYDWPGASAMKMRQNKGHHAEVAAFLERVRSGGAPAIPFHDLDMVTAASFGAVHAAQEGCIVRLAVGGSD